MVCAVSSCESIFFLLLLDLVSRETGSNARDRAGCKGAGMFSRTAGVAASAAASGAAAAAGGAVELQLGLLLLLLLGPLLHLQGLLLLGLLRG